MKKPMKSNNKSKLFTATMFAALLLLTACDGGIFGTGGGPDMIPPGDNDVAVNAGTEPNQSESGNDNGSDGAATSGTTGASTTGGTTSGADGDTTGVATAGDSTTDGSTGSNEPDMNASPNPEASVDLQFINDTAVLTTTDPRLTVVNASNITINVFASSVEPDAVLLSENGLAPQTASSSVVLPGNENALEFVNNNNLGELLGSYGQFDVADSTLSTVFVRQLDGAFFLHAAASQVSSSDPSLARVRVAQASDLNDASQSAQFSLLATGANPSGVDASLSPVNFFAPVSAYVDIPAGDYEFSDALGRKDNETFSLSGGTVYTITVLGAGATPSLLNNDTATAN